MVNNTYKRHYNRWTVNEILSLQREYELLEMTVKQISLKHQRSVYAILYKLELEGFIDSWGDARGFDECDDTLEYKVCTSQMSENSDVLTLDDTHKMNSKLDDDNVSNVDKLTERIWNLETTVNDISGMVKQMFDNMVSSKSKKNNTLSIDV